MANYKDLIGVQLMDAELKLHDAEERGAPESEIELLEAEVHRLGEEYDAR